MTIARSLYKGKLGKVERSFQLNVKVSNAFVLSLTLSYYIGAIRKSTMSIYDHFVVKLTQIAFSFNDFLHFI